MNAKTSYAKLCQCLLMDKFMHTIPYELKASLKDTKIDNLKSLGQAADAMNVARNNLFAKIVGPHENSNYKGRFNNFYPRHNFSNNHTSNYNAFQRSRSGSHERSFRPYYRQAYVAKNPNYSSYNSVNFQHPNYSTRFQHPAYAARKDSVRPEDWYKPHGRPEFRSNMS